MLFIGVTGSDVTAVGGAYATPYNDDSLGPAGENTDPYGMYAPGVSNIVTVPAALDGALMRVLMQRGPFADDVRAFPVLNGAQPKQFGAQYCDMDLNGVCYMNLTTAPYIFSEDDELYGVAGLAGSGTGGCRADRTWFAMEKLPAGTPYCVAVRTSNYDAPENAFPIPLTTMLENTGDFTLLGNGTIRIDVAGFYHFAGAYSTVGAANAERLNLLSTGNQVIPYQSTQGVTGQRAFSASGPPLGLSSIRRAINPVRLQRSAITTASLQSGRHRTIRASCFESRPRRLSHKAPGISWIGAAAAPPILFMIRPAGRSIPTPARRSLSCHRGTAMPSSGLAEPAPATK
ncbi:hypothetical protein [Croceicoccus naphthovorans]|uniref:hypothetical protein n=1 Tax=Croceicoccus naphthovorans TaxID=1348774 RepID=UPI0017E8AF93|nr:hypothetical protein [Croceicoccus naphthovorans]MBB3990848.1 hypothetical protein [Croceicoccus naphthovorans]